MRSVCLAILVCTLLPALHAQQHEPRNFVRDFGTMQKRIWLSPFRMDRHTLLTRALPLAAGTAGLIALDRRIARGLPNTDDQVRWSNRVSHAGGLYSLAAISGLPLVAGKVIHNEPTFSVGMTAVEALAASVTVNYALKYSFLRERPDEGVGNGHFFRGGDSFPSGHAMSAWAICTAIARHNRTPVWLKVVSYGVATSVSLSRIGARRHFASDVFAGAAFGAMIGNFAASRAR